MKIRQIKTQMHMQEWTKIIEARQSSGLSIKKWCEQNNLSQSKYYYYLKKLRLAACEPLMADDQRDAQFAMVPKRARESNQTIIGSSNIRITLPGAVIEIGERASEAQIRFSLEVLLNVQ